MPKFSIITVCYNSEKTIEDTLKSVEAQTYKDYEYIIVDGKSTDNTLSIIEKYKNILPIRLISEKDKGLYDAMNKGIRLSNGEIIAILNSDDYYENETLDIVSDFFDKKNIDLLCGNMRLVDYFGNEKEIVANNFLNLIKKRMPVNFPSTFVKKEVYNELGGFNIQYKVSADYDFICRAYTNGKVFSFCDRILSNMREGGLSGGGSNGIKGLKISLNTAKEDREIVKKNFKSDEIINYYKDVFFIYLRILKRRIF